MTARQAGGRGSHGMNAPHFGASLFGREQPLNPRACRVARLLPSGDLTLELVTLADASIQALAAQPPDLDLGMFDQAACLGVKWNSSRRRTRCASGAGKAS